MARHFAYNIKPSKQWLYPSFTPTIAPDLVARVYAHWLRLGKPPVTPAFIEDVMSVDQQMEAHLYWFEDVINYVKDNEL